MRDLPLTRLLHAEPREVGSDLRKQCFTHPSASCSASAGDDASKKSEVVSR